jgi:uncharacterized heparinase superfamily protein
VSRDTEGRGTVLHVAHDGYADRFSIVHERFVALSADGNRLDGEDVFKPAEGDAFPPDAEDHFAVRFHLHPGTRVYPFPNGRGAMLTLPNRDVWHLMAYDDIVAVEESVYLAGQDGPRRTSQVVIYGQARTAPRVHWTLIHVKQISAAE